MMIQPKIKIILISREIGSLNTDVETNEKALVGAIQVTRMLWVGIAPSAKDDRAIRDAAQLSS